MIVSLSPLRSLTNLSHLNVKYNPELWYLSALIRLDLSELYVIQIQTKQCMGLFI